MRKVFTYLAGLLLALSFSFPKMAAQSMYPGDINNNGLVNGVDMLYWGAAYEQTGPLRPVQSVYWQAYELADPWEGGFPGGPNFSYADCNGDGRVTGIDLNLGVRDNYGKTHGTPQLDDYRFGTYNVDPLLHLKPKSQTVGLGNRLEYEVFLGEESLPVDKFHGITFIISYDKSVVKHNAATFEAVNNPWFVRIGNTNSFDYQWESFWKNNYTYGSLEVALFKYAQVNATGYGKIGEFSLVIKDNININTPSSLDVKIEAVMMTDNNVTVYPVATKVGEVILSNSGVGPNCPEVIDPVCGSDGVTYINSCYAEAAGVTDYTRGVCFSDCIDPEEIKPDVVCTTDYEPVCGCNNVTYMNACAADAAGVINFTAGPCSDNAGCYDPIYVVTNSGTNVNYTNGAITISCDDYYEPVCGCNGVTYQNACYAEASGITFYTQGACDNTCIDPANMDPDPVCTLEYDPVCGCNGITYPNACAADAAGLVSYSSGPCGNTSPWCLEATQIQCGDFLAYETTEGAGNQIDNYPGCTPHTFAGNDKVYVLHKSTAGDLQIGLEILTPDLDLDLFLLKGSCDEVSCIRASLTDNQNTNNEGIILEDAPIGTYYIVVDAQHSSAVGEFRLEVNCGYLQCGDAVPLTCGEPYFGNNGDGEDNVSLYGCDGNVLNVENNGPERVHYFTLTEPGAINIYLGNMTANLELFLLRSCDRGECIDYSQRPGTSYEVLSAYLQAGTYYIVVDGYNGAVSDYALTVTCSSNCDFDLTGVIGTGAGCGQSNGSISINSEGGTPGFLVFYEGPISGSFSTTSNNTVLHDVPPGVYHLKMVDANGCSDETTVEVPNSGGQGLAIELEGTDVACGQAGSIHVTIENGTAPYDVYVSGPESASLTTNASSFNLENLWAGEYTVYIKDATGCSDSQSITIEEGGSNFSFTATPTAATCGGSGSIKVLTQNGSAPYTITLEGPVSGSTQTHLSMFTLADLPGGHYKLTIEDGNWCSYEVEVTIDNSEELDIYVEAEEGVCGNSGAILITMSNGQPIYGISWSGPVSGSASTANDYYLLEDLPSGTYVIRVEDSNWCSEHATVQLSNSDGSLSASILGIDGQCGEPGGLWVDIENGAAPYKITWEGPTDGSLLTYETAFDVPGLPGGSYTVKIKDDNDCSVTEVVYVNESTDLSIDVEVTNGTCGEQGSLWVSITGGQTDYIVSWDGPVDGSASTDDTNFAITDLPAGTYTIEVTDATHCTDYQVVQITSSGEALDIEVTKSNPTCGANNGYLWVEVENGTGPYTIKWSGPLDGAVSDLDGNYQISNLVAGSYSIEIEDANGCYGTLTKTLYAQDSDLDVELIAQQPTCGEDGEIKVKLTGGSKPYQIKWDGPTTGTVITNATVYTLSDLEAGDYTIKVTEDNGCSFEGQVSLQEPTVFDFAASAEPGECGQLGALAIIIGQGTSPYHVSWTGPDDGSFSTEEYTFKIADLPSGDYAVEITDANGCSKIRHITLTNADGDADFITITPFSGDCGEEGKIKVQVASEAEKPYQVSWSGASEGSATTTASSFFISNLESGTYSVKLVDDNGCSDTEETTLENNGSPVDLMLSLEYDECGLRNIIKVAVIGGEGPYTVGWDGPATGETTFDGTSFELSDLAAGTYTFKIEDANGCGDNEDIIVPEDILNLFDLAALDGDCEQDGAIKVDINGGEAEYKVTWTGPVSGETTTASVEFSISDLPSGDYEVVITDANGCTETEHISINNAGGIDIDVVGTDGDCNSLGYIYVKVNEGQGPFLISWSGDAEGSDIFSSGEYFIEDLGQGSYTVEVADDRGCSSTVIVTIAGIENDLSVSLDLKEDECGSEDIIAVTIAGGAPNYKVSWNGPTEGSATIDGTYLEIPDLISGTYAVDITDDNGCTASAIINVTAATVDLLEIAALHGECGAGGELKLAIVGGTPNYTIEWSGADEGSITTTETNVTISDLPAGDYAVKLTDANGCTDEATVTITITEGVSIRLVGTDGDCTVKGHIFVEVTEGNGPFTIKWTGDAEGTDTFDGDEYFITDLLGGTYTVEVTNTQGCSETESITIEGIENTLDISLEVTNGSCSELGSFWVNIGGGVAPITLSWEGPVDGSREAVVGSNAIEDLPSGTYTIEIEDANGCKETIVREVENEDSDLAVSLEAKDDECGSENIIAVTITGGAPNYKVSWSGPTEGSATIGGSYVEIPDLLAGTYTVEITDDNGCIASATEDVNAGTVELLEVEAVDGDCEEVGELKFTITGGTPDYTIEWSGADEGSLVTSETSFTLSELPPGEYVIKLTDSNGCMDEASATIAVTEGVGIRLVGTDGDCTVKGHIFVEVTEGTGPFTVKWTGDAEGMDTFNGDEYFITDLLAGTYTVEVTNEQACSQTESVTIQGIENTLDITLEATNGVCGEDGSFWVNIGGGVAPITLSWDGPEEGSYEAVVGSNAIEGLPSGTYTIEIKDANGCTETIVRELVNQGSDLALALGLETDECGQEDIITVTITGGTADYTVKWNGPIDGTSTISGTYLEIPDLVPGEYQVTIADAGGCEVVKEIVVNTGTVELLSVSALPGVCEGTGDIVLAINGGSPTYAIEWTGPADGSATTDNDAYIITEVPSGNYTISLTDANGCTDVENFSLNNGEGVQITVIPTDGDCYQKGSIFVGMDGGIKPYRIEWDGPEDGNFETDAVEYVITDLEEGIYTISVLDEGGCIDTKVVTVNGFATDLSATIEGNNGDCGSVGNISLEISGGQSPYVINWSGASSGNTTAEAGTTVIDDLGTGTYNVVVTDANGCIVAKEVEVHNGSGFSVDLDPSNGGCGSLGSIKVDIDGGTAQYLITWTGNSSGAVSVSNPYYNIEDLPAGTYEVKVTDDTGCSLTETATIETSVDDFEATILAMSGDCGEPGKILINMSGGTPAYKISWSSTNSSGSVTTNGTSYEIEGLPTGIYNVTVKDDNNCTVTKSLQILNANNWISLFISSQPVSCDGLGSIGVSFNGGVSPYNVSWTGPEEGNVDIDNQQYIIGELPTGTYEVHVEDAEGCSNSETVYVGVANDDIIVDFTYDMTMLKVDFINNSSSGTYHWDFGNGQTSSEKDPWIEFAEPGTYQVCLSVTNDCGTKTRCEYIELVVPSDAVILDVGEKLGSYGSTIYVPVTIENCDLLVSVAGSLDMEDTDVAEILGLSPGAIAPTFNSNNHTFNFYDNNGTGVTLEDGEVLFNIVVKLKGAPGEMSALFITDDPLTVEVGSLAEGQPIVKPHLSLSGKVTITEHALVEGTVNNYRGIGIEDAEVRIISQVMEDMEMTDENGYFSLSELEMGEEYTITANKNDNPVNGLSTFALFIGQRFILGMDPPQISSPYQIIAGDANCNGAFTTLDLFIIQQLIIGATDGFASCPSWVFVSSENELPGEFDAYNVFPYQDRYEMMVDHDIVSNFIGVKVGDILGQAATTNLVPDELDERDFDDELVLSAIDRPIAAGETVELSLSSNRFSDMVSYQFGIDFDTQKLRYESFVGSSNADLASVAMGTSEAQNGGLKVSWFSMDGAGKDLMGAEDLLTIRFTAIEAIPSLASVIDISDRQLKIEAVNGSWDQFDVVLDWQSKLTEAPTAAGFQFKLHQNTPNPFHGDTDIRFELPENMEAEILIHDNLGRIIKRIEGRFEGGMNKVELRDLQLEGGVYFYTLRAGEYAATRHMVILN